MEPGRLHVWFRRSRRSRARRDLLFSSPTPCIDFQIDVDQADDVALMKVIQYRRQLMRGISIGGSERSTWYARPSFLRQMSSGTAKADAGTIAKTKQISGGSSCRAPPPRTAALIVAGLVAYSDSKYAKRTAVDALRRAEARQPARRRTAVHVEFLIDHHRASPYGAIVLGEICPHRIGAVS